MAIAFPTSPSTTLAEPAPDNGAAVTSDGNGCPSLFAAMLAGATDILQDDGSGLAILAGSSALTTGSTDPEAVDGSDPTAVELLLSLLTTPSAPVMVEPLSDAPGDTGQAALLAFSGLLDGTQCLQTSPAPAGATPLSGLASDLTAPPLVGEIDIADAGQVLQPAIAAAPIPVDATAAIPIATAPGPDPAAIQPSTARPAIPQATVDDPVATAEAPADAAAASPPDPLRSLLFSLQRGAPSHPHALGALTTQNDDASATTQAAPDDATDPNASPFPPSVWQRPDPPRQAPPAPIDAPSSAGIPAAAQLQTEPPAAGGKSAPQVEQPAIPGLASIEPSRPASERIASPEPPTPRAPLPSPVDRAIAGQVTRQLVRTTPEGDRTLVIRLTPPELGTVRIELREHAGTLTAHLHVEDEAVARTIDRMLPAMRQELRAQESPLADLVREPRDQRQNDGRGQPQDQAAPWARQQERDGQRQGRRQDRQATSFAALASRLADPAAAGLAQS
jgi:hypothetical protein